MRIDSKLESSTVNGPGDRAVIWVNGCNLKCKGCWNEHTHAIDTSKNIDKYDLLVWLRQLFKEQKIEGVTFSGGEPLQQVYDLGLLTRTLKREMPELSIGLYTGYTLNELESGRFSWFYNDGQPGAPGLSKDLWHILKGDIDFAIMGRFNQQQLDTTRPYCSSRNQEIVLFSDDYTLSDFNQQEIEFQIDANGFIQITGFPVGLEEIQSLSAFNTIERDW